MPLVMHVETETASGHIVYHRSGVYMVVCYHCTACSTDRKKKKKKKLPTRAYARNRRSGPGWLSYARPKVIAVYYILEQELIYIVW